jgi:hypothetical protein
MLFDGELEHGRGTCISDSSHTGSASFHQEPERTTRRHLHVHVASVSTHCSHDQRMYSIAYQFLLEETPVTPWSVAIFHVVRERITRRLLRARGVSVCTHYSHDMR